MNTHNTAQQTNRPVTDSKQVQTASTVAQVAYAGPEAIERRLEELDNEWTTGRVVKVVAGLAIVAGFTLAVFVDPWWLALPAVLGLLLLQYTFSRDSVLTWLLRGTGLRPGRDIEHERVALKALRGDFRNLPTVFDKADADAVARLEGEGGPAGPPVATKAENQDAAKEVLETLKK